MNLLKVCAFSLNGNRISTDKKMKKYFLILLTFLLLSCNHKKEKTAAPDIIPKQEMIQILVDVELAESAISMEQVKSKSIDLYSNYYYNAIFKKYKISQQQFEESLRYYLKKNDDFNEMFVQVINILSRKQSETMQK